MKLIMDRLTAFRQGLQPRLDFTLGYLICISLGFLCGNYILTKLLLIASPLWGNFDRIKLAQTFVSLIWIPFAITILGLLVFLLVLERCKNVVMSNPSKSKRLHFFGSMLLNGVLASIVMKGAIITTSWLAVIYLVLVRSK